MDSAAHPQASVHTRAPAETEALGERIGHAAQPGDCIALIGELGAGKTIMAKGIARGLGIDPKTVTSPTFVLMSCHQGRLPLFHFDAYRLSEPAEMLAIGAEETFYGNGLCVIEWADRVAEILPKDCLEIRMLVTGDTERTIQIHSTGARSRRLVCAAMAPLSQD